MSRHSPQSKIPRIAAWSASPIFAVALAIHADVESTQALGHGFRLVVMSEAVVDGFEGLGHFRYCYYKSLNLGRCNQLAPSPSGDYAIYQASDTGLVMFFDSRSGESAPITSRFHGLLGDVSWEEARHVVRFTAGSIPDVNTADFDFSRLTRN